MRILIKILFLLTVCTLAVGLLPMAKKLSMALFSIEYVWVGIISFFAIYRLWLKNRLGFLQTLDHEMSHAVIGLLFGHTMIEMYIHDRMGGHVKYYGNGRGKLLIDFAPYIIRMPMIFMVFLSFFVSTNTNITRIFYMLLGIAICYSVISILEEAKPFQTDLNQHGLLFSYSALIALNIIWFCIMTSIILPRFELVDVLKSLMNLF